MKTITNHQTNYTLFTICLLALLVPMAMHGQAPSFQFDGDVSEFSESVGALNRLGAFVMWIMWFIAGLMLIGTGFKVGKDTEGAIKMGAGCAIVFIGGWIVRGLTQVSQAAG